MTPLRSLGRLVTAPPELVARALDDLHVVAELARRFLASGVVDDLHRLPALMAHLSELEADVLGRIDGIEAEAFARLDTLQATLEEMRDALRALPGELDEVRRAVEPLPAGLEEIQRELAPLGQLTAVARAVEPLEKSMLAVRESVDELEPMVTELDGLVRGVAPRIDEIREAVEPIGELAERIPGGRRRK